MAKTAEALETPGDQTIDDSEEEVHVVTFDRDSEEDAPDNSDSDEQSEDGQDESEDDEQEPDENDQETGEEKAEEPSELEKLRTELESVKKDRDRLGYKLRQQSQQKPEKETDKEAQFTDAQLVQLISEHKEEPEILLQIMKQVNKQEGAKTAETQIKAAEIKQRRTEIDKWMAENVPGALDENSPDHEQMTNARSMLNLEDHPYGDFLGVAAANLMVLPQMLQDAEKRGREAALKEKGETTRKKTIKENSQSGGKPKTKPATGGDLDAKAAEVIGKLGLQGKAAETYKKMLSNSKHRSVVIDG